MPRRKTLAPDAIGHRAVVASFDKLGAIVRKRTGMAFVWPDEGAFEADPGDEPTLTVWRFNERHADFEPLWVDPSTANLMLQVHSALTRADLRARLVERVARDRGAFGQLVEFCWSKAGTRGASFTSG